MKTPVTFVREYTPSPIVGPGFDLSNPQRAAWAQAHAADHRVVEIVEAGQPRQLLVSCVDPQVYPAAQRAMETGNAPDGSTVGVVLEGYFQRYATFLVWGHGDAYLATRRAS